MFSNASFSIDSKVYISTNTKVINNCASESPASSTDLFASFSYEDMFSSADEKINELQNLHPFRIIPFSYYPSETKLDRTYQYIHDKPGMPQKDLFKLSFHYKS